MVGKFHHDHCNSIDHKCSDLILLVESLLDHCCKAKKLTNMPLPLHIITGKLLPQKVFKNLNGCIEDLINVWMTVNLFQMG